MTNEKSELLVGQVPLINDIALSHQSLDPAATSNNRLSGLLWIGDRDERIKCCYYPQCHVIKDFYLAHESYVGALQLVDNERFLVSAGGDCYANIWRFQSNDHADDDDMRARRKGLTAVRQSVTLSDASESNIFAISSIVTPEATLVFLFDEKLPLMHIIRLDGNNNDDEPESRVVQLDGLVLSHAIVDDQLVLLLDNSKIQVYLPAPSNSHEWISAPQDLVVVDSTAATTPLGSIIAALAKRSCHFPDPSFYRARCVSQLRKDFILSGGKRKQQEETEE